MSATRDCSIAAGDYDPPRVLDDRWRYLNHILYLIWLLWKIVFRIKSMISRSVDLDYTDILTHIRAYIMSASKRLEVVL